MEIFAGRFALIRPLGQGGMGDVHLARDLESGATVALKRGGKRLEAGAAEILRNEFENLARVRHPVIVRVHEFDFAPDGTPFLSMEYVPGVTSDHASLAGDWPALLFVAAELARGLEALHAAEVVHGDLKPTNVLVMRDPRAGHLPMSVRLLDLGLSGLLERDRPGHTGTPGFQAPEVVGGHPPSPASDLYGVGATLFVLATGVAPFAGEDASTMLHRQQQGPPSASLLEHAGAPAPLVELILRLMAPQPEDRTASAADLRRELEAIHPAARRPLAERLETAVLAGRERELAAFETIAAGAPGGRRVMLVAGAAGQGKTMLLDAFAARATLAGRMVVRRAGVTGDLEGECLRALTRRLENEAGEYDAPEPGTSPDEIERWVGRAVTAIGRVAERRGEPLLFIDDADRLDEVSRAALRRIWLHQPAPPARWVLGLGTSALDAASPERLLVDAGVASWCELGPLGPAAVAALASTRLGAPAPDALLARLKACAGGHPGLVVAMLREAARRGVVTVEDGVIGVDGAALAALDPPLDYAGAERGRMVALAPAARAVVLALATMARPVAADELTRLAGSGANAVAGELAAAGVVLRDEAGAWSCASPWAARRLLADEPAPERLAWHRRALELPALSWREKFEHENGAGDTAAALEAAESAFAELPDAALAAAAAGLAADSDAPRAARWHERAARELVARGRYDESRPHWTAARGLEADREPEAGRRALGATVAALRSGHLAEAEAVATASIPTADPVTAARLEANLACALDYQNRTGEASARARAALAAAERADDPEAEVIAAELLGSRLLANEHFDEAGDMLRRAAVAARRPGVFGGEARSRLLLGALERGLAHYDVVESHCRAGILSAREGGQRVLLGQLLTLLGNAMLDCGRWADARPCFEEALRTAVEDARGAEVAVQMINLAVQQALTGRGRAAARSARRAFDLQVLYWPARVASAWRVIATAKRLRGRLGAATRLARRALRLAGSDQQERLWCRIELAMIELRRHRWANAENLLGGVIDGGETIGSNAIAVAHARHALASILRGDTAAGAARIALVERWLETHPEAYSRVMLAEARAALLLAEGKAREGIEAALRALDGYQALSAQADRACAALRFAGLALERGLHLAPGLEWIRLAARTFERNGDLAGRVEALAAELEWRQHSQGAVVTPVDHSDLLGRVSDLLRSYSDPQALTHRAMQLAVEQLRAERGVLLWMEPISRALTPIAEYGAIDAETREEAIGYSRQVTTRVAESGGPILVRDVGSDRRMLSDSVRNMRLRSIVCVPMFLSGVVVGAVYLDDSRRPNAFGDDERRLLEGFAGLMAVAIDSSRGRERVERQRSELERENRDLLARAAQSLRTTGLLGTSPEMQEVFKHVEDASRNTHATVLVTGESGTGKELVARTIHELSRRRDKRFIAVNCGAITDTLLESELFGHKRGAFTGATRDRQGAFEMAAGGTLFLDEIAEMPPPQQVKLLSVLGNRQVTPVGENRPLPVDVRVVAATNADLRQRIAEGRFREDLYFRLCVLEIELPPLRDRKADIPALAQSFLEQFCARDKRPVPRMLPQFTAVLMQSDWPGNVRELQNYVERVLARTEGNVMFPDPLPFDLQKTGAIPFIGPRRLPDAVEEFERRMIRETLERLDGNQSATARELGISEQTLRYKLRLLGLPSARQNQRTRKNRRNA